MKGSQLAQLNRNELSLVIATWHNRWSRAYPDPAWADLRAKLEATSKDVSTKALVAIVQRWLKANPSIAAKIDGAISDDRTSRRAFELEKRHRLAPEPHSRKAMRSRSE